MGPFYNQWVRLCRAMGQPDLVTDQRFATAAERVKNQAEAIKIFQDWIDRTPDGQALAAKCERYVLDHCRQRRSGRQTSFGDPSDRLLRLNWDRFPSPGQSR
jgi:CoA-transferase family III